jgi:hypothetical protein
MTMVVKVGLHATLRLFSFAPYGALKSQPTNVSIAIKVVACLFKEEPEAGREMFGCSQPTELRWLCKHNVISV